MKFKVYFEFYGRKLKTEIEAPAKPTREEIIKTLMQYLDVLKVEEVPPNPTVEQLKKIFGMD